MEVMTIGDTDYLIIIRLNNTMEIVPITNSHSQFIQF
jgi:hypothetical protein